MNKFALIRLLEFIKIGSASMAEVGRAGELRGWSLSLDTQRMKPFETILMEASTANLGLVTLCKQTAWLFAKTTGRY